MKKSRNFQILLLAMVLSISFAYLIADYLPSQGINILTFGCPITGVTGPCNEKEPRRLCCTINSRRCFANEGNTCRKACPQCFPPPPPPPPPSIMSNKSFYGYEDTIFFWFSGFDANGNVSVLLNYSGVSVSSGLQRTDSSGRGNGALFLAKNLPSYVCPANLTANGTGDKFASFPLTLNLSGLPSNCRPLRPTLSVVPTSVNAQLGQVINFTANVTNLHSPECGNVSFVFNGSSEKFTFQNITGDLVNFSANPDYFILQSNKSQIVNFSFSTLFAPPSNYTLNVTARDNLTYTATANISFNLTESLYPLSFNCTSTGNGYKCDLTFLTNSLESVRILFLVSNNQGKIVSSGGLNTVVTGYLSFNFYCSTFGAGTYHVSWIAYKSSDQNLTSPIAYSTSSEDKTITC